MLFPLLFALDVADAGQDAVVSARADQYVWSSSGFSLPAGAGSIAASEVAVLGRGAVGLTDELDARATLCVACTLLLMPSGFASMEYDIKASQTFRVAVNGTVGGIASVFWPMKARMVRGGTMVTLGRIRNHVSLGGGVWYGGFGWGDDEPYGAGVGADLRMAGYTRLADQLALVGEVQVTGDPVSDLSWQENLAGNWGAAGRLLFDPVSIDLGAAGLFFFEETETDTPTNIVPWLEVAYSWGS